MAAVASAGTNITTVCLTENEKITKGGIEENGRETVRGAEPRERRPTKSVEVEERKCARLRPRCRSLALSLSHLPRALSLTPCVCHGLSPIARPLGSRRKAKGKREREREGNNKKTNNSTHRAKEGVPHYIQWRQVFPPRPIILRPAMHLTPVHAARRLFPLHCPPTTHH